MVKQISRNFRTRKKSRNKGLFISWLKLNFIASTTLVHPNISFSSTTCSIQVNQTWGRTKLILAWWRSQPIRYRFRECQPIRERLQSISLECHLDTKKYILILRNIPLFFAESEYRIYTRLQPLLQIFDEFFIIFCRIGIFRNEILFYFIKLMNFQIGRIIFLVGFLIDAAWRALLSIFSNQSEIEVNSSVKPLTDLVMYIPELTARSTSSKNKFVVMKPSSKASSAVK